MTTTTHPQDQPTPGPSTDGAAAGSGEGPLEAGPIFIAGRQHSGNTVTAVLLAGVEGCYAQVDENTFFEHRALIDRMPDRAARVARIMKLLKIEDAAGREAVGPHLRAYAEAHPDADAMAIYLEGMRFVTRLTGNTFWAQKATSYIFYGRQILRDLPDARLVYMLRNPYDIAASKKRRSVRKDRLWQVMLGWNKGIRLASELLDEFPGRFRVVRYEDIVTEPERETRALLEFLGIPFRPSYLDVPHVNRSETGYSLTGTGKGLNRSRVFYYVDNLAPSEIAALDAIVDRAARDRFYPELPHAGQRRRLGARLAVPVLLVGGAWKAVWEYFSFHARARRSPKVVLTRTIHRLKR